MSFTPLSLRALIRDALGDEIGTYQWGDDITQPALRVEGIGVFVDAVGNEMPKPDFVNGLEVVIQPTTNLQINSLLGSDYFVVEEAQVFLKQFDITKTTLAAAKLLRTALARYLPSQSVQRVQRNELLDSVEMQVFTFSFFTN